MCELFGISTKTTYPANELLRSFFTHSKEHHSGWGIAVFHNRYASIEKEPVKALDSRYLKERLRCLDQTGDMLAHIRLATVGYSVYENCHPFAGYDASGRQWVLIHNGTLFGASFLSRYSSTQIGTTDSEQLMLHILDLMDQQIGQKERALSFEERFAILDQITCKVSDGCKLNYLLHDGEYLYVHSNFIDSLYYLEDDDSVIFSTQPLLVKERWKPFPKNRLHAYQNGSCVAVGTDHGHTFTYSEEQLQYLYTAFATL